VTVLYVPYSLDSGPTLDGWLNEQALCLAWQDLLNEHVLCVACAVDFTPGTTPVRGSRKSRTGESLLAIKLGIRSVEESRHLDSRSFIHLLRGIVLAGVEDVFRTLPCHLMLSCVLSRYNWGSHGFTPVKALHLLDSRIYDGRIRKHRLNAWELLVGCR